MFGHVLQYAPSHPQTPALHLTVQNHFLRSGFDLGGVAHLTIQNAFLQHYGWVRGEIWAETCILPPKTASILSVIATRMCAAVVCIGSDVDGIINCHIICIMLTKIFGNLEIDTAYNLLLTFISNRGIRTFQRSRSPSKTLFLLEHKIYRQHQAPERRRMIPLK